MANDIKTEEIKESIGRWIESDYIDEIRQWTEEYNAKVDRAERYYTKKREFDEDYTRDKGKTAVWERMSDGRDFEGLDIGVLYNVEAERVDSEYIIVFKVGDTGQYFRVSTNYDSWSDWDWDWYALQEVYPKVITKTIYTTAPPG